MIRIVIPGEPIACCRPRVTMRNGYAHAYDPQEKRKQAIKMMARVEWNLQGGNLALKGPIELTIAFYCPIPASGSVRLRNWLSWGFHEHTVSYDLDNLSKTYMDALTGIVYDDDRQVVALKCRKSYSLKPRTEITIMEVKDKDIPPKAEEILCAYGPELFADLADIAHQVLHLGNRADAIGDFESSEVDPEVLTELASIISRLADTHSKVLSKIAKSHPGFYLEGK